MMGLLSVLISLGWVMIHARYEGRFRKILLWAAAGGICITVSIQLWQLL